MKKHGTSKPYITLGELAAMASTCASRERDIVIGIRDLFLKGRMVARTRLGMRRMRAELLG
jgi:hypothetical protein